MTTVDRSPSRFLIAGTILFGTFLMGVGTHWDINWHATVGRDSLWIPPHLIVYTGTLLTLAGAILGLAGEHWPRRGRLPDPLARRAAAGTWITAAGGLWFVGSVPFDDLWHRLFGLDVTIWSPPHISLIAAGWTIVFGALLIATGEQARLEALAIPRSPRRRALEWALVAIALSFLVGPPALAITPAIRFGYLRPGALGPWLLPTLMAALLPAAIFAAPVVLRRPAGVTLPALLQFAVVEMAAVFAALGYAVVFPGGVPNRSPLAGFNGAEAAFALVFVPALLILPAMLADVVLLVGQKQSYAWVAAALALGAALAVEGAFAPLAFGGAALPLSWTIVAAAALAVLAVPSAWIGLQLGHLAVGYGQPSVRAQ